MIRLVFTCGDINGIGPEICVKTFSKIYRSKKRLIYFICPLNVFEEALKITNLNIPFIVLNKKDQPKFGAVNLISIGNREIQAGKITKKSGAASFQSLNTAMQMIKANAADAIITSPISKTAIHKAGFTFPGHTEFLASKSKSKKFLMTFLSNKMICSLATIHIALNEVSKKINKKTITQKLEIFRDSLVNDIGLTNPKIAVLGLNPHAGESGGIGEEEKRIIEPALKKIHHSKITGPYVPDAFFGTHAFKKFDAVLGMYHDQILIPFKLMNFNKGVNFTAGLPFIRTSPDHGTAFDIAWQNRADESSMFEAVKWAEKIFKNRNK